MNLRMTFLKKIMKAAFGLAMLMTGLRVVAGPVTAATTNSAAGPVTNTLSVFVMPADPKAGRDPFFPSSLRPYQTAVATQSPKSVEFNMELLMLQGISGLPPHRLAIINRHTFAAGDYGEVSTSQGRVHLHCLEITANSALIEVNGARHELRYQEKQ